MYNYIYATQWTPKFYLLAGVLYSCIGYTDRSEFIYITSKVSIYKIQVLSQVTINLKDSSPSSTILVKNLSSHYHSLIFVGFGEHFLIPTWHIFYGNEAFLKLFHTKQFMILHENYHFTHFLWNICLHNYSLTYCVSSSVTSDCKPLWT